MQFGGARNDRRDHRRVDAVPPEHTAHAQADEFAASGMAGMSSMGMVAPEGKKRRRSAPKVSGSPSATGGRWSWT